MKEGKQVWQTDKYYRCRPQLFETVVVGDKLLDLDGVLLLTYKVGDFAIERTLEVLDKEAQFCGKIRTISQKLIVVFGMNSFHVVDVERGAVTVTVEVENMIECVEAKNGHVTLLTSDEDGENKLCYCWRISPEGAVEKKYEPIEVGLPNYEDCNDENIDLAFIQSLDGNPRVYIFWRGTNQMIEVDPSKKHEERYSRIKELSFVTDLDKDTYAEISQNKIAIHSKNGGKELAIFTNEGENFTKVFYRPGATKEFFSISNKGVKRWKLESNSEPVLLVESDHYPIEALYFSGEDQVVGVNTEKKYIITWKNNTECVISNFPNEIIRKIIRLNETQACLLLEATASKEIENEHQVEKYNKMEIFDFEKNEEVAKKAVLKFEYKIDIDSAIADQENTIRFILNEETPLELKKYIFRWSPFCADKKKEVKKREIAGAKDFDSIRLYPFDRILTFKKSKETELMYDVFGKSTQPKSQVSFFDFSAKKMGEYELSADVAHVEMGDNHKLYAIAKEKFSIYQIDSSAKGRLEKIHELEVAVSSIYPIGEYLIMKKESHLLVYDKDFELLMKEDCEEEAEEFRVMRVDGERFLMADQNEFSLWDLKKEEKVRLRLGGVQPNLAELMGKHVVVADKWIKAYDF